MPNQYVIIFYNKFINRKKANVNFQDNKGRTVLMIFTYKGNYEMVKLLLSKGANFSLQDSNGNTAVHYLIFSSKVNTKILKLFINKNFNFGIKNKLNVS